MSFRSLLRNTPEEVIIAFGIAACIGIPILVSLIHARAIEARPTVPTAQYLCEEVTCPGTLVPRVACMRYRYTNDDLGIDGCESYCVIEVACECVR